MFYSKKKSLNIFAPISGKCIPLSMCSDQVFSSASVGEGVVIIPNNDFVYAPFDGTVSVIYPTLHALILESNEGVQLLLHFGINSFSLNGNGISIFVEHNEKIRRGQKIAVINWGFFKKNNLSTETPIILLESNKIKNKIILHDSVNVTPNDIIIKTGDYYGK